jgi:hypothetical protein
LPSPVLTSLRFAGLGGVERGWQFAGSGFDEFGALIGRELAFKVYLASEAGEDRGPGGGRHSYDLHGIFRRCNNDRVDIDWPADFGRWLDRLEDEARSGDERSRLILGLTARALDQLRNLTDPPTLETETATLRQVRQSRRYELWRVSHAYHPQVAVRLICWFPPGSGTVVVALFATDKARMGDVFYDGVSARADPMIDQWKRETSYEEKP